MNAHRPRRPFRLRTLAPPVGALLLSLAAAAGGVPGAAQQQQQAPGKKAEVQIGVGDMDLCGGRPQGDGGKACLRGKVRTVTVEQRPLRMLDGRMVEGGLISIDRTHYDERGNATLVEMSDSSSGPVGVFSRRGVFVYDEEGRLTSSEWYVDGSDAPKSVVAYSYDGRGNRTRIDSMRREPDAHIVQEFSYDEEGREVGGSFSSLKDGVWQTQTRKTVVTVEGRTTHTRTYSTDGRLRGRVSILRDDRGNTLGEEMYRADERGEEQLRWKVGYRYDKKGFLREAFYPKADEWLGARAVYEYDERGGVTTLKRYRADGSFAAGGHREYEYDAAGNWVRRVTGHWLSEDGPAQPYRVERRRITYY